MTHPTPVDGWKSIARVVALSPSTCRRLARRDVDPLPVFVYLGRVVAWPAKLVEWQERQLVHYRHADFGVRARSM